VISGSVEYVFCEHFIEHLTEEQGRGFLRECHRVLRPGGRLRLSTPDLRRVVDEYLASRTVEWHDVGWRPLTPCRMVNESFRLWGHRFIYDAPELAAMLASVGFDEVSWVDWRESTVPELAGLERRPYHGELIVEAVKPAVSAS
jgi:predicted SAM-dependent methyltransferase